MVITLYKNSITIVDEQHFEKVDIDNYQTHFDGVSASGGIYILDITKNNQIIITIRTNNLIVIDNRK